MVVGIANLGFDKDIFSANQNSGVTMNIGKVTSSLSDIANMVTGGVGVYATLTETIILSPEVIVGIAATGLTLGAASLATGNTNIDVTGIKNNLADILENTVGQFEGGINALMNNWQQYQDSGQSPLGFILDTSSQFGGTMKTTGLSLSLSDLESSVVNKDKWAAAQNTINELLAVASVPIYTASHKQNIIMVNQK